MSAVVPDRIEIVILADGSPLPGALADVSLSMVSKNPHDMVLGPGDASGRIVAVREELLEQARRNCSNFLMDYSDLATRFGGSVEVKPVTPRRLVEMEKAYELFGPAFGYPAEWEAVLAAAKKWFIEHRVESLEAQVRVEPSEVRVSVPEVRP
jgi:hypothetical protein